MSARRFFVFGGAGVFERLCADVCKNHGFDETGTAASAEFAIAPRLDRRLRREEWSAPLRGTLIFHPSVLPYRRGPDAVRWAVLSGERVSGVTWFWCTDELDAGDVCEQEPVVIPPGATPGRVYADLMVPAGVRALKRAVQGILLGAPRRIPQDERGASHEGRWGRVSA